MSSRGQGRGHGSIARRDTDSTLGSRGATESCPSSGGGDRLSRVPPDALTLDWRLSSGGCLKGDVTVTGDAKFWIVAAGDNVIVRERFEGKGNGFSVVVTDTGKPQP